MSQSHPGQMLRSGSETVLRILFGVFMAFVAIALAFCRRLCLSKL